MNTSILNPQIPFLGSFNGSLRPFTTLHIRGFIHNYDGRCVIDFKPDMNQSEHSTKIFHISMRPTENAIVRNTFFQHGSWGHEERDGHYHIKAHERFEISITAEHNHYSINLNHRHFANYHHRMPLHMVQYYCISGNVTIEEVRVSNGAFTPSAPSYPMQQNQTMTSYTTVTPSVPVPMPMQMQMQPMQMQPQTIIVTQQPPPPRSNSSLAAVGLGLGLGSLMSLGNSSNHHHHHNHHNNHHGHHGHHGRHF